MIIITNITIISYDERLLACFHWSFFRPSGTESTHTHTQRERERERERGIFITLHYITLMTVMFISGHYHIFVGDLSPDVETHQLREAFAPFGQTTYV